MSTRTKHRLATLAAMVLAGLLMITGLAAAAVPGYGPGGITASLSATVVSGGSLTVDGAGFVPGEPVTGTVFSNPMNLGTKKADSSGSVTFTFSVKGLDPGEHRVVLSAPSGSVTVTFIVVKRSDGDDGNGGSGDNDSDNGSDHSSGNDHNHHHDDSNASFHGNSGGNSGSGDNNGGGSDNNGSSDNNGGGSDNNGGGSGSGSGGSSSSGSGSSGSGLAFTGSNLIIPLSVGGLVLLLVGAATVVGTRRRRVRGKTSV